APATCVRASARRRAHAPGACVRSERNVARRVLASTGGRPHGDFRDSRKDAQRSPQTVLDQAMTPDECLTLAAEASSAVWRRVSHQGLLDGGSWRAGSLAAVR